MYKTGTKFEVKTRIKMGETVIEPGTKGGNYRRNIKNRRESLQGKA